MSPLGLKTAETEMHNLMSRFRPKSILSLVLIGFSIVALPLLGSLIYAVISVDRLLDQSQRAVFQAVQATKGSLALVEQIKSMERNIRQFQVLGDQSLFQLYEQSRQDLQITTNGLSRLSIEETQRRLVDDFTQKEQSLFRTLKKVSHQSEEGKIAVETFATLSELAQSILAENRRLVSREVEQMEEKAKETQQLVLWQAMGVTPIALAFAVAFTFLIARPIGQIDEAIRKLGDGRFTGEIAISGPRDLEILGKRLDWLRSRLKELEEQKTQFLRHVSHELKTPLTASRAGAELLSDEVLGTLNAEQEKVVQILHQSMIQLQKMIENLLNFSVVLERHATFTLKPVVLSRLVEKVLSDHHLALMARNIKVEAQLIDQSISGDENKLIAVIDNLVSNAVKFSPHNGIIQVHLAQKDDQLELDVVDDGPGVEPEDHDRVFDPFYQGRHRPNTDVEGTGLGLSLAKEYVLAHHGTINILDGPSKGAHLRVTLPLHPFKDD
ncbi:MAG: ATP-binding protein [Nitrospiria bacterium]